MSRDDGLSDLWARARARSMMIEKLAKGLSLAASPFLVYGFGVSLYRGLLHVGLHWGAIAFIAGFVAFAGPRKTNHENTRKARTPEPLHLSILDLGFLILDL
jgi:hypothetical protein